MTNTTTTFKKLASGSWGIKGVGLVSGQTVTVVKRDGDTKRVVVGDIVARDAFGNVSATIAANPTRVVVAEVTVDVPATKVTEEGFYLLDGQAYKVIGARDGSFHYARLVTGHGLKKAPGMYDRLTPAMKMTPEQIAAYGVRTRVCVNCSHTLTDPASQRVGLGTECGPAILGKDVYRAAYKAADAAAKAAQVAADAAAEVDPGNAAEAALAEREMAESIIATRPRSEWETTYFAMAGMGFSDAEIRNARYGEGNW